MVGTQSPELHASQDGHVVTLELDRPPNNHITLPLVDALAATLEALDADTTCRAVVLAGRGRHFCAGADLASRPRGAGIPQNAQTGRTLYDEAARLFATRKPIVAAVQGAAVGAGLGLALVADFRVTCAEARFSANFARLGFHPGFGLSTTLPRLVGQQSAALLCFTGRRVPGDDAVAIGLADQLVPLADVLPAAQALAQEIAASAPLAVTSMRATLRRGLADAFTAATAREASEQAWLRQTNDYAEGVAAMRDRRTPHFTGA